MSKNVDKKQNKAIEKLKNTVAKINQAKRQAQVAAQPGGRVAYQQAQAAAGGIPFISGKPQPQKPLGKYGLSWDQIVSQVKSAKALATKQYIAAVLDPQYADPARIPTLIGYPSCITKLSYEMNVSPNASGNICLVANPQLGFSSSNNVNRGNYLLVLNDATYNANTSVPWQQATGATGYFNLQDKLPATMAKKWRVVGFSMRADYVGNFQNASGYFVNAFLPYAPSRAIGPDGAITANGPTNGLSAQLYQGYSEDTLKAAMYSGFCPLGQTCEILYSPRDDVDLKYMNMAPAGANFLSTSWTEGQEPLYGRETSHLVISGFNLPPSVPCVRVQIDVIIEYIATPSNWVAGEGAAIGSFDPRAFEAMSVMMNSNYSSSYGGGDLASKIYSMTFGDFEPAEYIVGGLKKIAGGIASKYMGSPYMGGMMSIMP